jgi:cytochrome c peroxidase
MKRSTSLLGTTAALLSGGLLAVAGCQNDGFWCGGSACGDSSTETAALVSLADLPAEAPYDPSNAYATDPGAIALGRMFFHDKRFSGVVTMTDSLGRPVPFGRAPKGQPAGIACSNCHDFNHGGADSSALPGNVSSGGGWTFSNALPVFNAAFYQLFTWSGRLDSLWAQGAADSENPLTTNGNRLHTAWLISELYRPQYEKVFGLYPLPMEGKASDWDGKVIEPGTPQAGQCKLEAGACPSGCREVTSTVSNAKACFPRFPLNGKPGKVAGCQFEDGGEPAWDAFDCMADDDRNAVTRVLINYGKSIAAFESTLISRNSPFDRWVVDLRNGKGDISKAISEEAKVGARIFVGKGACNDCHSTPLLSDNRFHNIGVEQIGKAVPQESDCPAGGTCDCAPASETHAGPSNCIPWGARDGIEKLKAAKTRRDLIWSDNMGDTSRMSYVNMNLEDMPKAAYRTPSLRNVAVTAPYMHNGSLATLEEVVWHYNKGGSANVPGARDPRLKPLFLSDAEQQALVSFLKSLTSEPMAPELIAPPTLP